MKNILMVVFVCMWLSSCHQNLRAVNSDDTIGAANQMESNSIEKNNLVKGKSFKSGRETFVVLPELYSTTKIPRKKTQKNNLLNSSAQHLSELIETKGGFAIYKSSSVNALSSMNSTSTQDQELLPVVLNTRTNNFGILSGKIKVVVNDMKDAKAIATDLNLGIVDSFGHLNTVFFISNENQDVISLGSALEQDARIKSVSIEVLENFYEPH